MTTLFTLTALATFTTTWTLLRAIERRMDYRAVLDYRIRRIMESHNG